MKDFRAWLWCTAVLAVLGSVPGVSAQAATPPPEPLSVTDVLDAPTLAAFSPPSFSPDNRFLAYVVTDHARRRRAVDDQELLRAGVAWYGIASDIWIADLQNGKQRNLTEGRGNSWAPSWSPDGQTLAFMADRSPGPGVGPARLWVWERSSGRLRQVGDADVREGFIEPQWTRDGRSVLVSMFPEDLGREGYSAHMRGAPAAVNQGAGPDGAVTAKVFEFDASAPQSTPSTDQVSLDHWRRDLAVIDVASGKVRRIAKGLRIGHYLISPDGWEVAYTVLTRAEKAGVGQYLYQVVVRDLRTDESQVVASDVRFPLLANSFSWSPSGEMLAFRTGGPAAEDDVYVVPAGGGPARRVAHNPPTDQLSFDVEPPVWDAVGRNVFFIRKGALWRAAADV